MADHTEYIVSPWEIEAYVQSLDVSVLENIGTKRYSIYARIFFAQAHNTINTPKIDEDTQMYFSWLEIHKRLTLLNQQSVLEITGMREESVMEWFVSLKKVSY